jgi:putative hydrolase of the HAD superfamily
LVGPAVTRVRAVCFDLWNTLITEGEGGLLRPRSLQWREILAAAGIAAALEDLDAAHQAALVDYKRAWEGNEQFRSTEAASVAMRHLGLSVDDTVRRQLIDAFHDAGLQSMVAVVPGALSTLNRLRSEGLRTAIICDIGLTPSSALRHLLRDNGVLELIDVEAWSDELGCYKPDAAIFGWTLDQLGVDAAAAAHVGDRKRTDVAGARAAGMVAIRFTGVYDDPDPLEEADFVLDDLEGVVGVVGGV